MKLINFRPILFLAVGVCLGILSAYLYNFVGLLWSALCFVLPLILLITFIIISKRNGNLRKAIIFTIIAVLVFTVSFFNFKIRVDSYANKMAGGFTYSVSARVREERTTDEYTALVLDSVKMDGTYQIKTKYKMTLYIYAEDCNFGVGDKIEFTARVDDLSPFYEGKFSANYLSDGIKYSAYLHENSVTITGSDRTIFEKVNLKIRGVLKDNLDAKTFATAYAMLCGNSDYMNEEILRNYRSVGVAHVFAVSGLHIGFLAVVLRFILKRIKVNKYIRFFIITATLIFYSGICGFSSSAVRATIMLSVSLIAELVGRKYDGLSSISLSLIIVLLINPIELFAVGFQLSFAVVYGILLLGAPIKRLLKFMPNKLGGALSTVMSSWLISMPICLAVFKEFSAISIVANLIFIPVVGIIFVLTFSTVILTLIFGAGSVFLFLPSIAIKGVNFLFGLGDYSAFMIGGFIVGAFSIPYFLALIFSSDLFNLKRMAKRILVGVLCVITISGTLAINLDKDGRVNMYISGSNTLSATVFTVEDETVVVLNSVNYVFNTNRLERALSRANANRIDRLILPESSLGVDVQIITSTLLHLCPIESVYYTKELSEDGITVLGKSFPETNFYKIEKSGSLEFSGLKMNFKIDAHVIVCEYEQIRIALFSRFGGRTDKLTDKDLGKLDLIVANDHADEIEYFFSPNKMMTYSRYGSYENGEVQGNYLIKIK